MNNLMDAWTLNWSNKFRCHQTQTNCKPAKKNVAENYLSRDQSGLTSRNRGWIVTRWSLIGWHRACAVQTASAGKPQNSVALLLWVWRVRGTNLQNDAIFFPSSTNLRVLETKIHSKLFGNLLMQLLKFTCQSSSTSDERMCLRGKQSEAELRHPLIPPPCFWWPGQWKSWFPQPLHRHLSDPSFSPQVIHWWCLQHSDNASFVPFVSSRKLGSRSCHDHKLRCRFERCARRAQVYCSSVVWLCWRLIPVCRADTKWLHRQLQ